MRCADTLQPFRAHRIKCEMHSTRNGCITKIRRAQHKILGYFRREKYYNKFFTYCSDIGICKSIFVEKMTTYIQILLLWE